jgi:U4/U6 small nuclear ribonucleoprotein PRP31
MDLADELLLDLQDLEDEGGPSEYRDEEADFQPAQTDDVADQQSSVDVPEGGVKPAEELDADEVQQMDMHVVADVNKVARLASLPAFQECLKVRLNVTLLPRVTHVLSQNVELYRQKPPSDMSTSESPEYQLIVKANNYAVEVDNEVLLVHKVSFPSYAPTLC